MAISQAEKVIWNIYVDIFKSSQKLYPIKSAELNLYVNLNLLSAKPQNGQTHFA